MSEKPQWCMTVEDNQEMRVAIHEAGHAVMALLVRGRVYVASIVPGHDSEGHVDSLSKHDASELLIAASGVAAERIAFGKEDPGADGGDIDMLPWSGGVPWAEWIAASTWLLAVHWKAVIVLARQLIERRTMNGHDIKKAIGIWLHPSQSNRPQPAVPHD